MYPEYIPIEDEHVLPAEEQPLTPIDSPTVEPSGYVAESNPKEDPEEYEDDETEDDSDEDEEDEKEEEHLASADSAIVIPTVELASSLEGTEPVILPPSSDTTTTGARITVRLQAAISLPSEAEVERLLAMPTLLPSPLASLSPPSARERLARYEIRESSTARLIGGRGIDYGFVSTLDAEARRRGIGEVGYGIRDTWVDLAEVVPKIAPMTIGEVNNMVTALAELHVHYTQDLYALLEDTHDSRTRISQRVTIDSQRVDLLMEDRTAHQETILIVEEEDYTTREA
nr:hypothetical protein [Tanacetum cinerariifolium]